MSAQRIACDSTDYEGRGPLPGGAKCPAEPMYECICEKCIYEHCDSGQFFTCEDHQSEAYAKHRRLFGRSPQWRLRALWTKARPPVANISGFVVLGASDYVAASGNPDESYRSEIAQASKLSFADAEAALAERAKQRGIKEVTPIVALGLIRAIMWERYEVERLRGES